MLAYYIQINVICIIILVGLTVMKQRKRGFNPTSQIAFDQITISAIVMCISDIFAWIMNGKSSTTAIFLLYFFNILYYISTTWVCFAWVNYVDLTIHGINYSNRRRILNAVPLMLIIIVVISTPFTRWMFSVDYNGIYSRGSGVILHWIVSWGYLVYSTFITLRESVRATTKFESNQYKRMMLFIIMPALGALIQMTCYGVTATACGITLSVLMLSYGDMQEQVYSDSLTGLNNRRSLERYIESVVLPTGTWVSVLMCDIDKFKSINDTYGHLVGDLALKRMASVLKKAVGSSTSRFFLCRYGGDEFIICGANVIDDNTLPELVESINKSLEALNEDFPEEISFSISIGLAEKRCTNYSEVDVLIREADKKMYIQKEEKKAKNV